VAKRWAFVAGRFLSADEAAVPLYDAGFVYGAVASDVLRTFRGVPFRLEDHVDRFLRSCRYIHISLPYSRREIIEIATVLVERSYDGEDLGLVLVATPGPLPLYAGLEEEGPAAPLMAMHTFPLKRGRFARLYREGLHVITPAVRQIPVECWDPKAKCRSRLHWWLAQRDVQSLDAEAVPVLLDLAGNLTESSAANLLVVRDGYVWSAEPDHILWGISLQTTRELCEQEGIPFGTRALQLYDARVADEILLTNSLYCIAPVTRWNGSPVSTGAPGPMFWRLFHAWERLVGVSLVEA
jgi:branched-chain amino acid aminotransferase